MTSYPLRAGAALAAALVLGPAPAGAGGFEVLEHGAAATGMVGAFTAKADDVSALFYNPAGLADQRGLRVAAGTVLVTGGPSASSTTAMALPAGGEDAAVTTSPLPTVYAAYGSGKLAVGVGAFTQYGLKVDWPDAWTGRFLVQRASLETVTVNPTVAWRPLPWLGVGGGVTVTPAAVDLRRSLDLVAAETGTRFRGEATGVGGNVGVVVDVPGAGPVGGVRLGASYRSRYDLDFDDGSLTFADLPIELSGALHDARAATTVKVPDTLSVGAGVRAGRMFVQAQLDWLNWSRFQELRLTSADLPAMDTTIPQDWHDGWVARLGVEAEVGETRVRGGIGYDWNPVPEETLGPIIPDSDRFLLSAGAGRRLGSTLVGELAVMAVLFRDRTSALAELPVEYANFGILTAFTVHYRSAGAR
jgi:long-chain fatty acid transport protein